MNNTQQEDNRYLSLDMFDSVLPLRSADAHKGTFGSVAVIGGAAGMVGSVLLAGRAALYSGAGRIYAALLSENAPAVDFLQPEIMLRGLDEIAQLLQLNCLVIGPGLGQSTVAIKQLEYWVNQSVPIVLDADALNLIAGHPHLAHAVASRIAPTVMTPHIGEAARLLACNTEAVMQNRLECAVKLATKFSAICVLKGAGTIIAQDINHYFINTSGNVGLASGGTGDVLSGIIGSLMAQGLAVIDAAKLGVYVHGAAADALVKKGVGPIGLTASEVILAARNILQTIQQK
ncbi:MAG TPA: NAD(P)H-hydrate dehydratase [Methylophilaceae bacterium]|nr:NAD(P)H-hydrate dehydratase [Methylophilaceae bacterium]